VDSSGVIADDQMRKGLLVAWYYQTKARQIGVRLNRQEHHLPPAYRFYLLQNLLSESDLDVERGQGLLRTRGLRFGGLLREIVFDMQRNCSQRNEDERYRMAAKWIGGIGGAEGPKFLLGNGLACRSKEALEQMQGSLHNLTVDEIFRAGCDFPASWRVRVLETQGQFVKVELVGQPQAPVWVLAKHVSRCPTPIPHNVFLGDEPNGEMICRLVQGDVFVSGGGHRGTGGKRLVSAILSRSAGRADNTVRRKIEEGDYCLAVEWRGSSDRLAGEHCIAEIDLDDTTLSCRVDTKKYLSCHFANVKAKIKGNDGCLAEACQE
jgi:hypothetical protein